MKQLNQEKLDEFVRRYWRESDERPKYQRLAKSIQEAIADRFWSPGDTLPSEMAWVSATPCGLATVQRAFRDLTISGVIHRKKGSGTLVGADQDAFDEPWHMRFLGRDQAIGGKCLPVSSKVLFRELNCARGGWSDLLKQDAGDVLVIGRIFDIGGEFKVLNTFYAHAGKLGDILGDKTLNLDNVNIKKLIAQRAGLRIEGVRHRLVFDELPSWVGDFCAYGDLSNYTTLNAVAFGSSGEALYYQDFYIPRNDYVLELGSVMF